MVEIKGFNWREAGARLRVSSEKFTKKVDDALEKSAEDYKEEVLKMIQRGNPSWVPKSKSWAKRSKSTKLYFGKTKSFVSLLVENSLRKVRSGKGYKQVFVGARYDITHRPSKLKMDVLAQILQELPHGEGSRPLFGPAWERTVDKVRRRFQMIDLTTDESRGGRRFNDMD